MKSKILLVGLCLITANISFAAKNSVSTNGSKASVSKVEKPVTTSMTATSGLATSDKKEVLRLRDLMGGYMKKEHKVVPVVGATRFQMQRRGKDLSADQGYILGAMIQDQLNNDADLQYGLLFYEANSSTALDVGGFAAEDLTLKVKLDYVGVPVYYVRYAKPRSQSGFYVKGGGLVSYLHSASGEYYGASGDKFSAAQAFKRYDILASLGLGFQVQQTARLPLNIEVLYYQGLVDVIRGSGPDYRAQNEGYTISASTVF